MYYELRKRGTRRAKRRPVAFNKARHRMTRRRKRLVADWIFATGTMTLRGSGLHARLAPGLGRRRRRARTTDVGAPFVRDQAPAAGAGPDRDRAALHEL